MSANSLYQMALAHVMNQAHEPPPARLRPSASIVPWRINDGGVLEVFWVRRSPSLGVLGGWQAFPGGGVSPADVELPVTSSPARTEPATFPAYDLLHLDEDLPLGIVATGLRELWEEVGLLVTDPPLPPEEMDRLRSLDQAEPIASLLTSRQISFDAGRLTFAGRWVTPPISPIRFDTRFFLLEWPSGEAIQPRVDGQELCEGEWIAPAEALDRWNRGDVLAAPPTLYFLEVLAQHGPRDGLDRLVHHGREPIHPNRRFLEIKPGIIAVPLLTPTLPPARETTSFIVGKDRVAIIDVGSPFEAELQRFIALLEVMQRDFEKTLDSIWLTHHHPDHLWGVDKIRQRFRIPVYAHEETARRVSSIGMTIDRTIADNEVLELRGNQSWSARALHTPGHAAGHLVFWNEENQTLIAGDLVAGIGTIMIDPDEGDMGDYLASLQRVLALEPKNLFPSHGPFIDRAVDRLRQLIDHRLARESAIEKLWGHGIRSLSAIVEQAYTDVSPALHPFAERQAQAHLIKLARENRLSDPPDELILTKSP